MTDFSRRATVRELGGPVKSISWVRLHAAQDRDGLLFSAGDCRLRSVALPP